MAVVHSLDIFNKWLAYLTHDHDSRYRQDKRKVHLQALAQTFSDYKVSFDEAKVFRKRAMEAITTPDGRRGIGKHKGWKEACLEDFDVIMADQYVNLEDSQVDSNGALKVNITPFTPDPEIKSWVDDRYGGDDDVLRQAHVVGNMYNLYFLDFLNEVPDVTT